MLQAQETGILSVAGARAVGEQGAGAGGGRRPDGALGVSLHDWSRTASHLLEPGRCPAPGRRARFLVCLAK